MASPFRSPREFREVMDRVYALMSEDARMGPRLREADIAQRLCIEDLDLVLDVRPGRADEPANLLWSWNEEVDWTPRVRFTMSSETANRYFQGRVNVAYAIARRRIKTGGDLSAALELMPITKPVHELYRKLIASEYPHLAL